MMNNPSQGITTDHHAGENGDGMNGDPQDVPDIVPIDLYSAEEGKLQASVSWLIAKVYGSHVPDVLLNPFYRDANDQLHMKPAALQSLTSGEMYCLAASRIFHDSGYLNQNHSAVLQALHRYSIDVHDDDQGAHLGMIDGLMTAHMRQVVSVDRVVDAVKKYTSVLQNEAPYDVEDALLFWINKICATVRDNLEKRQRHAPGIEIPIVPEMEDLYEDMCDGICIATLLSFYRPEKLRQQDICFHDQMSIADCVYNLRLQREFSRQSLPWNVFHFQIEDILYLHDSLRPNVNAFLADLFQFFERESNEPKSQQQQNVSSGTPQGFSSARRTLDRVGIPDLRSGSNPSTSKNHPTFSRLKQTGNRPIGSGATSMMNSTDSLMTQRSNDSLKYRPYKGASTGFDGFRKSPTTTFGELSTSGNPAPSQSAALSKSTSSGSHYSRSDSMPAKSVSQASIRLQLEEKKRQYEAQRRQENAQKQMDRQEMGKEAFFTLKGKPLTQGQGAAAKLIHPQSAGGQSPLRQPPGRRSQEETGAMAELNKNVQVLQEEIKRLSVEQGRITKMVENPSPGNMSHAISQPLVYAASTPQGLQNVGMSGSTTPLAIYATPQGGAFVGAAPMGAHPQFGGSRQLSPGYAGSPPTVSGGFLSTTMEVGTFRLHSDSEPASKLDPSLELNRNLTNWGMTYKAGGGKPSRKTWDNSTFVKEQQKQEADALRRAQQEVPHGVPIGITHKLDEQSTVEPQQQYQQPNLGRLPSYSPPQASPGGNRPPSYPSMGAGSTPSPPAFQISHPNDFAAERGGQEVNFAELSRRAEHARLSSAGSAGGYSQGVPSYPSSPMMPLEAHGSLPVPISESGGSRSSESPKASPVSTLNRRSTDGFGREQSPGIGFVVGEGRSAAEQKKREMEQKREQLMANAMRRREEVDQKRERAEREAARKREQELKKQENAEKRKIEKEIHRQKVLEEYQRKKAEQEAKEHQLASGLTFSPNSPSSSNASAASTPRQQRLARGHSQPPRPKGSPIN